MNMNGQYLMNKQVSVQYAYKKDGKGERHGDQAERTLAAQARKHNIRPAQPLAQFTAATTAPHPMAAMVNGDATYQNIPATTRPMPPPPPPITPLVSPPPGLPARPPPSQVGYGGPQSFLPPGFNQPQGFGAPPLPSGFQSPRGR